MFAAAMVSLGAGGKDFPGALRSFRTHEKYRISVSDADRCGFKAKLFKVDVEKHRHDGGHNHGRTLEEIEHTIDSNKDLPRSVRDKAKGLFAKLADAEAAVHFKKEKVHFHEVGAIDSIIDICAAALAIEILGIEKIYHAPVNVGHGTAKTDHGIIPLPSPAAAELLKGIPSYSDPKLPPFEFTTPTGALILAGLCEFRSSTSPFAIERTGYGAGTRSFAGFPNVLRASICSGTESPDDEDIFVLESLFDDATGEELGFLASRLLDSGALDCILIPACGKKGRPANLLSAVCRRESLDKLAGIILRESSSNGVRYRQERRKSLQRFSKEVKTTYGALSAKFAVQDGRVIKAKPEHDSILRLAKMEKTGYILAKRKIEAQINSKYAGKKP